ncbi:unnamed protein product [Paramecium sonneborni]|uniref:Uncharacterized protein n=1 Tax=Paramecium sonneborni TaxID=65129 RepID=A0A8S1Q5L8_9CILI|nr:unnamed protein product [Paramecium sonneborni]
MFHDFQNQNSLQQQEVSFFFTKLFAKQKKMFWEK